jgi:hypothetical protein
MYFAKVPNNREHPIVMQREVEDGQPTSDWPRMLGLFVIIVK